MRVCVCALLHLICFQTYVGLLDGCVRLTGKFAGAVRVYTLAISDVDPLRIAPVATQWPAAMGEKVNRLDELTKIASPALPRLVTLNEPAEPWGDQWRLVKVSHPRSPHTGLSARLVQRFGKHTSQLV